jgi:fructokinase
MSGSLVALGEYLIDFTPAGKSPAGMDLYERNPGGAPANVAAGFVRLGGRGSFAGAVGNDPHGLFLKKYLEGYGVDCRNLMIKNGAGTTLAFVTLNEKGDRSFAFYRDPGADTLLAPADLDAGIFTPGGIFHFGSLSLTAEPVRSATLAALDLADRNGMTVSYDPNWRPLLWKSDTEAKERMLSVIGRCHILKVSDAELSFLTGESGLAEGTELLHARYGIPVILVTLGAEGCFWRLGRETGRRETFTGVKTIDTTGAGDSFLSAFLYRFDQGGGKPANLTSGQLVSIVDFASAAASLSTTRRGAIPSLPDRASVEAFLESLHG